MIGNSSTQYMSKYNPFARFRSYKVILHKQVSVGGLSEGHQTDFSFQTRRVTVPCLSPAVRPFDHQSGFSEKDVKK